MLVQERVRLNGHLNSGWVCIEKAGHDGGAGSGNGWVRLRVGLCQVRVHELSQRIKSRVQELG